MDETGFIQKQNSRKLFVSKGSSILWSKCADANFDMTFVICVSAAKYVAPPLLIILGMRLNRYVIGDCDIQGDTITTEPKGLIRSTLFLIWIELFVNSVPDSVVIPFVLVYDAYFSHYNDGIVNKKLA